MARRMRRLLAGALAVMAIAAAPAQARVDEGGGAAVSPPAPQVESSRIDYRDAAIGIGIGVGAGALVVGASLALRRQRADSPDAAGPAAR